MEFLSASSVTPDAYRAGLEIGAALKSASPEVILLFCSINYADDFPSLFEGLVEELGKSGVLILGCTGDGIYETSRVEHHGVSALAINSMGKTSWVLDVEPGVDKDSFGATQRCARRVAARLGTEPQFAMVLADGVCSDGTAVASGMSSVVSIPILGGLAGDDRKFTRSFIFVNGEAIQRSVAVLMGSGEFPFLINAASGWTPVGRSGLVEKCEGSTMLRINGRSPQAFMREQLGKSPGEVDLGIVPLAALDPTNDEHYFLRTPSHFDPSTGSVTTFGSIKEGSHVRVCLASHQEVMEGVSSAILPLTQAMFEPQAAIVISCAGRRWLLEENVRREVDLIFEKIGKKIPLIGFPSFGEIGPFRESDGSYSESFFHNVTFVVCLLGRPR